MRRASFPDGRFLRRPGPVAKLGLSLRVGLRLLCDIVEQERRAIKHRIRAAVAAGEHGQVFFEWRSWPLALLDTLHVDGEGAEVDSGLKTPMPCKVIALLAEPDTIVDEGALLLMLEAMKMERNTSSARRAGAPSSTWTSRFRVVSSRFTTA